MPIQSFQVAIKAFVVATPFVFLVGLHCDEPEGAIALSDEHDAWCYVDAETWRARPLAPGYERALAAFFARAG